MCFVFLKATGSNDIATADFESQRMRVADESVKANSTNNSRKNSVSLAASIAPKNSASALDKVTERCIFENQWKMQP